MSKKRTHPIDELLGLNGMTELWEITKMAKHFEKTQKKKIVFAQISVIAEDGRAVYRLWNTRATKKHLKKLEAHLQSEGLSIDENVQKHLELVIPFAFMMTRKKRENDV